LRSHVARARQPTPSDLPVYFVKSPHR
jgi:hypothetical protein